jgi:hypothetical protein
MSNGLALLALLAVGGLVGSVVVRARQGRLGRRALLGLAGVCSTGLIAIIITDWPAENLARFWADHSVLSATLCTLLLVGAGFLAFEARDNLEQQELTESLATAAFGALVDHMIDVDLALALLCDQAPPPALMIDGKPLRWLRDERDRYVSRHDDDPRHALPKTIAEVPDDEWREQLVDQALRRVMAAMRDWSPLLCQTRQGTSVLVRVGRLRNGLLLLERQLDTDDLAAASAQARRLRGECEVLALGLELGSGVEPRYVRDGVLVRPADAAALPHVISEMSDLVRLAEASSSGGVPPPGRVCAALASGARKSTSKRRKANV